MGGRGKLGSWGYGNPDHRRCSQMPAPSIEEVEARVTELLTPSLVAPRQLERHSPDPAQKAIRMRARLLTLPVVMAILLGLVFRRIPSLAEVQRVLAREGLLWVQPLKVSAQAIRRRLDTMPAVLVAAVFTEVCSRLQALPPLGPMAWQEVAARFSAVLAVDGTTLEALRKQTGELRGQLGTVLGGKALAMVDLCTLRPRWAWYTVESQANEKRFLAEILAAVPKDGLLVYDLGLFSFSLFDAFTAQGKWFVTRLREKTAYRELAVLGEWSGYRDRIIAVGLYRSNPCQERLRLVEVQVRGTWYRYLTNVLDPERLSAQEVCGLYRSRWRIEEAFLLTKRLLGLAYLWSGSRNAVELQLYATLLVYGVLMEICQGVAATLEQPLHRISVEMVFRGCYHYVAALRRGEARSLVAYLAAEAHALGIIKRERRRHDQQSAPNALVSKMA